jgi:hypothetical protein
MQRMLLYVVAVVLFAGTANAASAAPRMPIGFFDDYSFRWSPDVTKNLLAAQKAGASVIHVTADWSQIAATKPGVPRNGNDPAYVIADLDALVETAPRYGIQLMINISGAPKWANGGKPPNHPPKNLGDLEAFAHMLARRYNGFGAHGYVGRWSVWNEPNLELFLTPQFSGSKIVSPATYVKLYRAAYDGIKSGNPRALVAIGETSNRGRNKPAPNDVSDTVAPATFAHLVSQIAPDLPFDAYATHPYPTKPHLGPAQKVSYPNVTLTKINRFGVSLKQWFGRRVPIWITEYGLQTKPEYAEGVTKAQQATYAKQALEMAAASPYVEMFVWFTIRDSPATWQSGLFKNNGVKKPAYAAFASVAKTIVGQTQQVEAGKKPTVKVYVPFMTYHDVIGSKLGAMIRVYDGKKLILVQPSGGRLRIDQSVSLLVNFKPVSGKEYRMIADVSDIHGQHDKRTIILQAT